MGRRIAGRFQATDDINLDGHHIVGMTFLEDLPRGGASTGNVLAWNGEQWTPSSLSGGGTATVTWGDILGKPSVFAPESHTHDWSEVTDKPTFVNSITAGTGISLSSTTGAVTVTCDLTWGELADKPSLVNSLTAGTGIAVSGTTGDVTVAVSLTAGTYININGATISVDSTSVITSAVESLTAGTGISISGTTGDVTVAITLTAGTYINVNGATVAVDSTSVASTAHTHTLSDITDVGTNLRQFSLNFLIDGIGATISEGNKGYARVYCDCTLQRVSVFLDQSDSTTFTLASTGYSGHTGGYTDITGGANFTISGNDNALDSTLSGWTTAYSEGDLFRFGVAAGAAPANATIALLVLDFVKDAS